MHIEEVGLPDGGDAWAEAERLLTDAAVVLDEFGDRVELNIAHAHLGDILLRQGRPADALAHYEAGLGNVMNHGGYRPETQRRLAQALVALGELDRAAAAAVEAAAMVADDDFFTIGSTSVALAQVKAAQGNAAEADRLFQKAVDVLAPMEFNSHWLHLARAEFLFRQGRLAEAEEAVAKTREQVARFGPNSPMKEWVEQRFEAARNSR